MKHFTIDFLDISLAFTEVGNGENILLCTHGYKQKKEIFTQLFDDVPKGWKIVAFDQPMHGASRWESRHLLFDEVFFSLLWEKLLALYPNAKWYLMGFSMGGKTAMMLQKTAPIPIHKMLFIAPAGIITHPLTHFFSYHYLGSKLFTFFLKKPHFILPIFEYLNEKKLMRPFSYRFAKAQFEPKENREYMLEFVPIYRKFHFDFEKYAQFLTSHQIEVYVLWGENDEVLPIKQAHYLKKHLPNVHLTILAERKHNMIETHRELVAEWVQNILAKKELF